MFDAELKNASHVSGTNMVNFIMDQGSKMDGALKAMKALIASCTVLLSAMVEPSEEEETSSSYSDLTPHDMVEIQGVAVGGGNQQVEEVDQVEDITTLTVPPVSATEVVVSIATLVSSAVGNETLHGCHMTDVTPPSLAVTFYVVAWDLPPLALLAPGSPPDVAETLNRVGMNLRPEGHEVSVPPPFAPSLAIDSINRREKRKQKKMETKLKKRNDRN